ncbi:kinase-like domain-containing protein [Achaetomium macrosporum]|uniref:non-specific serine/threonine protein kinase n=1 Tax=Achaetomium macrosporum TaxID=79813 RepID=A0AAN7C528_9PEZI|nr:kinase-like domain-containing protein [Achaetomium macrosporum]
MATVMPTRRRRADSFQTESFRIHEDAPSTEDTEMNESALRDDDEVEQDGEPAEEDGEESRSSESSDEEATDDSHIQQDMEKLQNCFDGFRNKYRLIKRIGEGTFSTVYKAEDLLYDRYDNSWDLEKEAEKWTPPPLKSFTSQSSTSLDYQSQSQRRRKPKYVAIKKIYVTSSPSRIFNELDLLHDLRGCDSVCPLITAFRWTDQVVAILPYFRHSDFRDYFRKMTVPDIAIYLRSLFTALASVHSHNIIHRDIKPTNFLYDPTSRRGVLVDFGLAEREGYDTKPCVCHDDPIARKRKLRPLVSNKAKGGFPREDTRPSRRANRAGTRGFRAPEVLFKCTEQTTKIDIWSAGVILLTILSRRFPFFNSADDIEAMIEIATIFGRDRMQMAALLHGCMLETTIPTIYKSGFSFEGIILWSTDRSGTGQKLSDDEKLAVEFLSRCMELDPSKRLSAEQALQHDFLRMGMDESVEGASDQGDDDDDEINILKV